MAGSPSLKGLDRAQRKLAKIIALGSDEKAALGLIGDAAKGVILSRFQRERGPGGIPWPKSKRAQGLAPNARGQKVAGRTLFDTGDLQNSLAVEVRSNEVEVGFRGLRNPAKAVANQYGANGQSAVAPHKRVIKSAFGVPFPEPRTVNVRGYGRINRLPARPMLGVDNELAGAIEEALRHSVLALLVDR